MELGVDKKIWITHNKQPIMGIGRYKLLKLIDKHSSLKKAAQELDISYKTAYNYLQKMQERLGEKIILSIKGGATGGSTELTSQGLELIRRFEEYER